MSLSELTKDFVFSIAECDAEKARDFSRAFDDVFVESWQPAYDLLCHALTSDDPEICNERVVSKLIENGAPVNRLCSHGIFPLFYAVAGDKMDILKLLLENGADPHTVKNPPPPGFDAFLFCKQRPIPNGSSLLHMAAHNNNYEIVKLLLSLDVKPTIDEFRVSPLHFAARNGSLSIVAAILNSGCEIASMNLPDSQENMTPLHLAIINDHEDVVAFLLEKGLHDDHACKNGFKLFYSAAGVGNKKVVELLLKHSQVKSKEDWLEGYIAMYLAAFCGHVEVVQMFLDLGVDPNAHFEDYLTPLHAAALGGHKNVLALLLDSGADLNNRIFPPLFQAVFRGHEDVVEFLVDRGADLNAKLQNVPAIKREVKSKLEELLTCDSVFSDVEKGVCTPIHCAASIGNTSIVKLLIKLRADVNAKSDLEHTPLFFAVCFEHEEVIACLLEAGADVEAGAENRRPFFTAIITRNLGIVQLLFKYMDPLKLASGSFLEDGLTPLQYSIKLESIEIVDFLLKNGASVNHYVKYDFPLHCAVDLRNQEIALKLIEHGAHIDHVCSDGVTALFHAITENDLDMCKLLIKKGASLQQLNKDGSSLLHYAIYERLDKKMIKFLVECGSDLSQSFDDLLPVQDLILCAMEDHLGEIKKLKTENIPENDEIITLLKVLLEHGSAFTVPAFTDHLLRSLFTVSCGTGFVTGIKLLLVCDCDFSEGLKALKRTYGSMVDRLRKLIERNVNVFDCPCKDDDVVKFVEDCWRFRKIGRLVTQWVAKKENCGMELKEEHLGLTSSEFARCYYEECKDEIQKMKDMVISGRVTFFDLLTVNEAKLAAYARNEDVMEALKGLSLGELFPIYSEDLDYQVKKGVNISNLRALSLKVLNKAFDAELPIVLANEIFSYVSSIDLRNLCRIYDPFIFLTADSPDL